MGDEEVSRGTSRAMPPDTHTACAPGANAHDPYSLIYVWRRRNCRLGRLWKISALAPAANAQWRALRPNWVAAPKGSPGRFVCPGRVDRAPRPVPRVSIGAARLIGPLRGSPDRTLAHRATHQTSRLTGARTPMTSSRYLRSIGWRSSSSARLQRREVAPALARPHC